MRLNSRRTHWALLATTLLVACGSEEHFHGRAPTPRGSATVHLSAVNVCPEITLMVVAPLQTSVGHTIDLLAQAEDPDGELVLPWWNSSAGTIAEPEASETTYLCDERGERTITFAVLDEGGCEQRLSTPVRCE